jgi:hypothetical protein
MTSLKATVNGSQLRSFHAEMLGQMLGLYQAPIPRCI